MASAFLAYSDENSLPELLKANCTVLTTIAEDTGLTETRVLELLDIKSPEGQVIALARMKDYGLTGHRSKTWINLDLVEKFETLQTQKYIQGTSFLLAVIVLHEFVHWGRSANNIASDRPNGQDYGEYWEERTFGMLVGENKATIDLSYKYGWKY